MLPPPDEYKANQELLKRVALTLSIQVEEVKLSSYHLADILATADPSRVALPLSEAIMDPLKGLLQSPASLPLHFKKG